MAPFTYSPLFRHLALVGRAWRFLRSRAWLIGLLCLAQTDVAEGAGSLKVMTFNVKSATVEIGLDQHESWDYLWNNSNDRRSRVVAVINDSEADIIGVQEMRLGQLEYVQNRLPGYNFYGVGRSTGTTSDSAERSGFFYRTSRFNLLDSGEFWLSETPEIPGTTFTGGGNDTGNPRMATWLRLRDNQLGRQYFVINTHWALDSPARVMSAGLMRDRIMSLADGLPLIAMGDFNETAAGSAYRTLVQPRTNSEFQLDNSYFQSGAPSGKTFHGYDGGVSGSPIDFILHSRGDFTAIEASIVRTAFDGYFPSDHYPVEATLQILDPAIPGDYDGNARVDGRDFLAWQRQFGSTPAYGPTADGNRNGVIDAADLHLWATSNAGQGAFTVPEPNGMGFLMAFAVGAWRVVRGRVRRTSSGDA